MLTLEEFKGLVSTAPPGSEFVYLLVRVPERNEEHACTSAADSSDDAEAVTGDLTPLERIQQIVEDRGGDSHLKVRELSGMIDGLSVRRLKRAIRAGVVDTTVKGKGRDNGAKLVSAAALRDHLLACNMVEQNPEFAPAWY